MKTGIGGAPIFSVITPQQHLQGTEFHARWQVPYLGMRTTEARYLKREDVDLEHSVVNIRIPV